MRLKMASSDDDLKPRKLSLTSTSNSSSSSEEEEKTPYMAHPSAAPKEEEAPPKSPSPSAKSKDVVYMAHPSAIPKIELDEPPKSPSPSSKSSNDGLAYVAHPAAQENPPRSPTPSTKSSHSKKDEEVAYVAHPSAANLEEEAPAFSQNFLSAPVEATTPPPSPKPQHIHMPEDHDQPDEPDEKVLVDFGKVPVMTTCPHCGRDVKTKVTNDVGLLAWIISIGMCFLGMFLIVCLFLCCVPHFMEAFRIREHRCPKCRFLLGKHFGKWSRVL